MSDTPKRFEDWEKVDCNECSHYWDSSCDGVSKDSRKPCNSYLATRSIVIPAKLKALEKSVKCLTFSVILAEIALLIHILVGVANG